MWTLEKFPLYCSLVVFSETFTLFHLLDRLTIPQYQKQNVNAKVARQNHSGSKIAQLGQEEDPCHTRYHFTRSNRKAYQEDGPCRTGYHLTRSSRKAYQEEDPKDTTNGRHNIKG
jgi:hypothetical protein